MEEKPLAGIKAVDFTWGGVGPFISNYLAWYGATVVKVENKNRPDITRGDPPYIGKAGLNRSLFFAWSQCAKKYDVTIDLNNERGVKFCKKLLAWTDVVLDGFLPGTMEKWGFDYDSLKEINPGVIMLRTCAHGQTGPLAKQPALGFTLTTLAGFNSITGWPDRDNVEVCGAYSDFIPPLYGGFAVIAALDYRRRTGIGQCIDLAQHEAALQFLSPLLLNAAVNRQNFEVRGNSCEYAAPYGVYRCAGEERWCAIAVFSDAEWESFREVIGNPAWTEQPEYSRRMSRIKNNDELDRLVEEWTIQYSAEEVMSKMQKAGIAAGLVANAKDLYENPQLKRYEFFKIREHAEFGKAGFYRMPPFFLSKASAEITAPPMLGEHNEFVCEEILNMSKKEYRELLEEGVFD